MKSKCCILVVVFTALTCILFFTNSYAAGNCGCTATHKKGDCSCWLKCGGYCTDYIKLKTGQKQRGNANVWENSNLKSSDIKKGDVAIFKNICHVAYIEDVVKDKNGNNESIEISEYNYGKWTDEDCMATINYGVVTTRTVKISTVDGGFWRPS